MLEKRIRLIVYIEIVATIILFIIGLISIRNIHENKEYHSKNDVAAYLYKYDHLPYNYITKAQRYDGFMDDGKYIGGDIFYYSGYITSYTDNTDLRECDISYADNTRGAKRLVYAIDENGNVLEVFYTDTHYGDNGDPAFTKITEFQLFFMTPFCFSIILSFGLFDIVIVVIRRKDADIILENIIIALGNMFRNFKAKK